MNKQRILNAVAVLILMIIIPLTCTKAEVAPVTLFDEDFRNQYELRGEDALLYSSVYVGGRLYTVLGAEKYGYPGSGDIYYYDFGEEEYGYLTQVKPRVYMGEKRWAKQNEAEKRDQEDRVYQLIGARDSGMLYGFNAASGQIGLIDADGIHWGEVRLDTTILKAYADTLPRDLSMPFIEGNQLYGYISPSMFSSEGEEDPEGMLLAFDLDTGTCTSVSLPDTYAVCPYLPGEALLLRRMSSGRLFLSTYHLESFYIEQEAFAKLPIVAVGTGWYDMCLDTADVGSVAFSEETNSIYVLGKAGLWRSVAGEMFALTPVDWPNHFFGGTILDWLTFKQSWALPDGSWLYGTDLIR